MEATGIHKLVLLYPYAGSDMNNAFERFQSVTDDDKLIVDVRVNPEMVGFKGLTHFAGALAEFIGPLMVESV